MIILSIVAYFLLEILIKITQHFKGCEETVTLYLENHNRMIQAIVEALSSQAYIFPRTLSAVRHLLIPVQNKLGKKMIFRFM